MQKVLRLGIAIVFLVLGLLGLVLPVIPGTLFLLLSFLAFSTVYEPAGRVFHWLKNRHPKLHTHAVRWRDRWFPDSASKRPKDSANDS